MDDKKLIAAVARLVKVQVEKEVAKQTEVIRAQIISEVAGMLNYSERKLLSELNGRTNGGFREIEQPNGDFERSMRNLKTMPAYKEVVAKVKAPEKKTFTKNKTLNELLNETGGFTRDEMLSESPSQYMMPIDGNYGEDEETAEPWTNAAKIQPQRKQPVMEQTAAMPRTIMGTDNRPVDMSNPAVSRILEILNQTDHKAKFDEIAESGDQFRDNVVGSGAPLPRYNSQYFDDTLVGG